MSNSTVDKILFVSISAIVICAVVVFSAVYLFFYKGGGVNAEDGREAAAAVAENLGAISDAQISDEVMEALKAKKWAVALKLEEERFASNSSDPAARNEMGAVLFLAATGRFTEEQEPDSLDEIAAMYARAAGLFSAREQIVPSWEMYAMTGLSEFAGGATAKGKNRIQEADRAVSDNPTISYAKAFILVTEGAYQQAQPLIELAKSGHPKIKAAAIDLEERTKLDIDEQKNFSVAESARYVVRFEGPARPDLAATVTSLLDREEPRIARIVGRSPQRRIEIILYTSGEYATKRGLPDWTGGIFDGRIRLSVGDVESGRDELQKILAHEYTHAAIFDLAGHRLPVWLNEGLAMYVEYGNIPRSTVQEAVGGRAPSLNSLNESFTRFNAAEANAAYLFSYAAVDLIARKHGQGSLATIVSHIADGTDIDRALSKTIGYNIARLEAETKAELGL